MKQIIQDLKNGETILEEVPVPQVKAGYVLIKTSRSLVSLGTERMLVEFGKANLIDKARQQPDKVKQVLDKIKTDGIQPTLEAVFNKLGQPLPLGYCNVGTVILKQCAVDPGILRGFTLFVGADVVGGISIVMLLADIVLWTQPQAQWQRQIQRVNLVAFRHAR